MALSDILNKMSPVGNKITRDMSESEYMRLVDRNTELFDENKELHKEIERLNNIIDKAREYIQDRYDGEVLTHTFDKDNVGELLNILKGVDKE